MKKRKKARARTCIDIYKVDTERKKTHYKSMTLSTPANKVWNALVHGMSARESVDIEELRAQRIRKGGK